MKVKTIKKIISKKLNEWLESITDTALREDVKDQLVLSGGSITSLFLQEEVNDYDVYIQDIKVCERLAKYYAKPQNIEVLNGNDKEDYLKSLPEDELYEETEYGENVSEEAIMFKSLHKGQIKLKIGGAGIEAANMAEIKRALEDANKGLIMHQKQKAYQPVFFSQNAISLSDDIQIVLRFTGTIEEIHKSFDFIHATNYFTFKEGLVTNIRALECIMTKELKYQGSKYPLTSVIRMKKFIGRKWTMNAGEILKMLFQVAELDLRNPVILEEQLIGVDIAYFSTLVQIIRETDPKKLTSGYLNKLIDRVFSNFDEEI